jgi:hypothetical protein
MVGMLVLRTAVDPDPLPGQVPAPLHAFQNGFSELAEQLGQDTIGFPVEDEHPVHDADAVQRTTLGLAVWRKGEVPGFTNGAETYALKPPEQHLASVGSSPLAECIIRRESQGNPNAVNPRTRAAGLGQFLPSTWLTTPAGAAGASVFDPVANRAMVNWMLSVGRGREFVTIGGC